jgi:hypothetical protein
MSDVNKSPPNVPLVSETCVSKSAVQPVTQRHFQRTQYRAESTALRRPSRSPTRWTPVWARGDLGGLRRLRSPYQATVRLTDPVVGARPGGMVLTFGARDGAWVRHRSRGRRSLKCLVCSHRHRQVFASPVILGGPGCEARSNEGIRLDGDCSRERALVTLNMDCGACGTSLPTASHQKWNPHSRDLDPARLLRAVRLLANLLDQVGSHRMLTEQTTLPIKMAQFDIDDLPRIEPSTPR